MKVKWVKDFGMTLSCSCREQLVVGKRERKAYGDDMTKTTDAIGSLVP